MWLIEQVCEYPGLVQIFQAMAVKVVSDFCKDVVLKVSNDCEIVVQNQDELIQNLMLRRPRWLRFPAETWFSR
jgi:hypothetical protein